MSHALQDQKWADVITALASKEIQRRTEIRKSNRAPAPAKTEVPTDIEKISSASLKIQ